MKLQEWLSPLLEVHLLARGVGGRANMSYLHTVAGIHGTSIIEWLADEIFLQPIRVYFLETTRYAVFFSPCSQWLCP